MLRNAWKDSDDGNLFVFLFSKPLRDQRALTMQAPFLFSPVDSFFPFNWQGVYAQGKVQVIYDQT